MGTSKVDILEAMGGIVGEKNISQDELDLLCYSRDMAPMPEELLKGYGMIGPEFIVRVKTNDQISGIMKIAYENDIPVTIRSSGSWALGGTLPMEGGMVLDLCGMDKILDVNQEDEYVRVQAGVVWKHLIDHLEKKGFQVGANPTSGPSATVGGFIATGGGGGIGVAKYGPVGNQIISMKVVLSDGRITETNPWDSWTFVGSEGTLGIISEVTLRIFPAQENRHFMLGFDSVREGVEAFGYLYQLKPYYLTFLDQGFVDFLRQKNQPLQPSKLLVVVSFSGVREELEYIKEKVDKLQVSIRYNEDLAKEEWESRYKTALSIKSLGPTLFSPEIQIPMKSLARVLDDLRRLFGGQKYGLDGMASDNGMVTLLPMILTDERKRKDFFEVFSYTLGITRIGYQCGGCVYGIGLHNASHMARIHGQGLEVMRLLRQRLDPRGILNPSKTTQVRIGRFLMEVFMNIMGTFPGPFAWGLKFTRQIPPGLIRFGLRVMGGQQR